MISEETVEKMFKKWWIDEGEDSRWRVDKEEHKEVFKAAISLMLPIIEAQNKAIDFYAEKRLNDEVHAGFEQEGKRRELEEKLEIAEKALVYYGNRMGSGGTAREALKKIVVTQPLGNQLV